MFHLHIKEGIAKALFVAAAGISVLAVALICVFLFANGVPAIAQIGLPEFLFGTTWRPANDIYGIFPMIVGSIYVTAGAIIVGVNVRPDAAARDGAVRQNVDMRMYRVIYDCIDEIEAAMKGMLAPKYREVVLGHAEVRQTYKVSSVGTVAGCYVQDGKIVRSCSVRVVRDGIVIHEGSLASLKRFKDDAREVAENYECGLTVEKFNDIKEGDIIEAFTMEEIPR